MLACLVSGCAAHTSQGLSQQLIQPGEANAQVEAPEDLPEQSPETASGEARESSADARPASKTERLPTLETRDPTLVAALKALAAVPSGENHRWVAEAYRRLGVLDAAHKHLTHARDLDRSDAAAFDGLARIWRDWGFAHLGLGDAYRAIYFAPSSPTTHNTLGTLLQAVGHRQAARQSYDRALALDPRAAYAINNLCYVSFLDGEFTRALAHCRTALRIEPGLVAARNNLALVHAATGRIDRARREFFVAGDAAAGQYNLGIVHLAKREYARAAEAFDAAAEARPSLHAARARAKQARTLAAQFGTRRNHADGGP